MLKCLINHRCVCGSNFMLAGAEAIAARAQPPGKAQGAEELFVTLTLMRLTCNKDTS